MNRLDFRRKLTWMQPIFLHQPEDKDSIVAVHLNILSYNAHKDDLSADIMGLTETYSNTICLNDYEVFSKLSPHGVALLVKKSLTAFRNV